MKRRSDPIYLSRDFLPIFYDYIMQNGIPSTFSKLSFHMHAGTIDRLANASTPIIQKKCTNGKKDQWGNCVKGMEDFDEIM